ncbi:TPA: hypothetical protein N0F65_010812 [Lagenidium giganteum]|uniref:Uncharacterized protein n=1 Tax=Lagenidium giganteum TaxID=4803 RepID=A0AAV2Z9C4_9STRA|nr:TPA: hypothetical protein N0F65_010812 [Lagenidium giganteum]
MRCTRATTCGRNAIDAADGRPRAAPSATTTRPATSSCCVRTTARTARCSRPSP